MLTLDEENQYARAYFEDGDKSAGQKLVTGNLRLVVKLALEYRRAWANVMDLVQEGNIGLAEAVKRFDPYRGVRFSSFARYWIRALILQFILKNFRLISFANTRAGRKLFFRLEQERARLLQAFGEATPKQLAENLDVSEEDVATATLLRKPTLSLTAPKGASDDGGRTLGDTIADGGVDVEGEVVQSTLMETVDEKMKAFASQLTDEREQIIWSKRLVNEDPVALAVLGKEFGFPESGFVKLRHDSKRGLEIF